MIDLNTWVSEAKKDPNAKNCGMFLIHNGVVRTTSKAELRFNEEHKEVKAMEFSFDQNKVDEAILKAKSMKGIYIVKVNLNQGLLKVGDDLMYILVGGDIRENVNDCLMSLLKDIKHNCVIEKEIYK